MKFRIRRLPIAVALVALAVGGCAGWDLPGVGVDDPGSVGVAPPNRGGGIEIPVPNPGGGDPSGGMRPSIETPVPGQRNPVAAGVWKLEPTIDGRHVTVLLSWWSGPAPCSVLDSVAVVRENSTITLTPFEGSDPAVGDRVACPAIAMLRGTIADLGELEPGTWTLIASGDLAPIQITVE